MTEIRAEIRLPTKELRDDLPYYTKTLGFRLDMIFPADNPEVAVLSGHGLRLRIQKGAPEAPGTLRILTDDPGFAGGATALVAAAKAVQAHSHIGITASSDTFYPGQERYDTYSGRVVSRFKGSMAVWQAMGVMDYEMESATLLTMCASQGLRAGMVAGVIVNRTQQEIPDAATMQSTENQAVRIVIDAARRLLTGHVD